MKHPVYLEDYIVCLCDLSDIATPNVTAENMVRLSKYDRAPIRKLATQVQIKRLGLTLAQADMVRILVKKYQKQLAKWKVDVSKLDLAPCLLPHRKVKQERRLYLEDGMLKLKFNYDRDLINKMHGYKNNQGRFYWDREQEAWIIYPSEGNVEFAVDFCIEHKFAVDQAAQVLYDRLKQYKREHSLRDITPLLMPDRSIINAHPDLVAHVAEQNYSFYQLCDNAWRYEYSLDQDTIKLLTHQLAGEFSYDASIMAKLFTYRFVLHETPDYLSIARDYCKLTNKRMFLFLEGALPGFKRLSLDDVLNPTTIDATHQDCYVSNYGRSADSFIKQLAKLSRESALVVTDTDGLDWYWFNYSVNKIWHIKETNADKNSHT